MEPHANRFTSLVPGLLYWSRLPALCAFAAMVPGVAIGYRYAWWCPQTVYTLIPFISIVFLLLLLFISPHRWYWKMAFGFILGVLTGCGEGVTYSCLTSELNHASGENALLSYAGTVATVPVRTTRGWRWEARIDSVVMSCGTTGPGAFRVQVYSDTCAVPSTPFLCRAQYRRPRSPAFPGDFDEYLHLARGRLAGTLYPRHIVFIEGRLPPFPGGRVLEQVRSYALTTLDQLNHEQHRALLAAAFLGIRQMDSETTTTFRRAGLSHLLALSGLHVGIISAMAVALLSLLPLSRRIRLLCTLPLLWFYALVAGVQPSLFRAVFMFSLMVFSVSLQRKMHLLNAVGAAGIIWLLSYPAALFSAGFQLSWGATCALIILYPAVSRGLLFLQSIRGAPLTWCVASLVISVCAFIGTAPLLTHHFREVSLFGIVANVGSVFLMAGAVWLYALSLLFNAFFPPAALLALNGASLLLGILTRYASLAHHVPFALVHVPPLPPGVYTLWVLCALGAAAVAPQRLGCYLRSVAMLLLVVVPALLLLHHRGRCTPEVTVLPTGSSSMVLVRAAPDTAFLLSPDYPVSSQSMQQLGRWGARNRRFHTVVTPPDSALVRPFRVARFSVHAGFEAAEGSEEPIHPLRTKVQAQGTHRGTSWSVLVTREALHLGADGHEPLVVPLTAGRYGVYRVRSAAWMSVPSKTSHHDRDCRHGLPRPPFPPVSASQHIFLYHHHTTHTGVLRHEDQYRAL